jgi:hypothetical protein
VHLDLDLLVIIERQIVPSHNESQELVLRASPRISLHLTTKMKGVAALVRDTQQRQLDILEVEDPGRVILVVKERVRRIVSVLVSAILRQLGSIEVTFDCVLAPA